MAVAIRVVFALLDPKQMEYKLQDVDWSALLGSNLLLVQENPIHHGCIKSEQSRIGCSFNPNYQNSARGR
jgi:hypothetical protein